MDTTQALKSEKKTCTKEKLLRTLSAIYTFSYSEGEGGEAGYGSGDGYPGTGLRHPDMPLYNMPKNQRHAILKHLEEVGAITISDKSDDAQWNGVKITSFGMQILNEHDKCSECGERPEWYVTHGFTQTGERSGIHYQGRGRFCKCLKEKWAKMGKERGLGEHIPAPSTLPKSMDDEYNALEEMEKRLGDSL